MFVRTCAAVREEVKSRSSRELKVLLKPPVNDKTSAYGWVLVSVVPNNNTQEKYHCLYLSQCDTNECLHSHTVTHTMYIDSSNLYTFKTSLLQTPWDD